MKEGRSKGAYFFAFLPEDDWLDGAGVADVEDVVFVDDDLDLSDVDLSDL